MPCPLSSVISVPLSIALYLFSEIIDGYFSDITVWVKSNPESKTAMVTVGTSTFSLILSCNISKPIDVPAQDASFSPSLFV